MRFSTTTRSPVVAVDEPATRSAPRLAFPAHDDPADGPGPRSPTTSAGRSGPTSSCSWSTPPADTAAPAHRPARGAGPARPRAPRWWSRRDHRPAPLHGPEFGSYPPDEVAWLLTDLSDVALEAPTEEREEAIQSGGAHYAESLPHRVPARRGVPAAVPRRRWPSRRTGSRTPSASSPSSCWPSAGPTSVLASLARAGTPVGILMRRWAAARARARRCRTTRCRIVRGRGIDAVALRYLAAHHDPARVVFVDGWTGKGAIARELADAPLRAAPAGSRPELAVLADPGRCARTFGTRDDYLIPSACLNSTVSGLVSRTVLNDRLIGPGQFHGAKFYARAAPAPTSPPRSSTRSRRSSPRVRRRARRRPRDRARPDPDLGGLGRASSGSARSTASATSTWSSPASARPPGCCCAGCRGGCSSGPARRPPTSPTSGCWPRSAACRSRRCAELAYSCVGLIHPRFTRGATGADGRAVREDRRR